MRPAWTGEQVRAAERPALERGRGPALMATASFGLAVRCRALLRRRRGRVAGARVVVLAGSGNNGGDGLWAAADLRRSGADVTTVPTGGGLHEAGAAALRAAGGRPPEAVLDEAAVERVAARMLKADLVLDAMLGTGASGGLRGAAAQLVRRVEEGRAAQREQGRAGPAVVAVDLPSGLDAGRGAVPGTVLAADETVTFAAPKAAHVLAPARSRCGRVVTVPLGVEDELGPPQALEVEGADLDVLWPRPRAEDHKYTRGVVGVVAGSPDYPGAALLTVRAALAAGTGMVRHVGDDDTRRLVHLACPEAVGGDGDPTQSHVQAWVAGPGAVDDRQRRRIDTVIDLCLQERIPAVLDAGALELVGRALQERSMAPWVVLTPHAGELEQLLGWCEAWGRLPQGGLAPSREQIEADPGTWARAAAAATGATVLLKGSATVIAAPPGESADDGADTAHEVPVIVCAAGSPWLATAGSGDTLAGILGTVLGHDAGDPDRLAGDVTRWLSDSPVPVPLRLGLGERLTGAGRWALLAGLAVAVQGRAARAGGQGPQPALPEDIRAALTDPSGCVGS